MTSLKFHVTAIRCSILIIAVSCILLQSGDTRARISELKTVPPFKATTKEESSSNEPQSKPLAENPKTKDRTIKGYVAFRTAHAQVNTKCFPPQLKSILAKVKKRFDATPVVSSGYRSYKHNRRVGGARRSYHMKCQAADIRVPGVGKYTLAKYLKGLPDVGGVGTYGCNSSVHVDIGPKRTWHWGCRRKTRRT